MSFIFMLLTAGCTDKDKCLETEYFNSIEQECHPVSSCSEGTFEAVPAGPNSDRKCQEITDCQPGEFVILEATENTDRVCGPCSIGDNYSNAENSPNCIPTSDCNDNEFISTPSTLTSDLACEDCETNILIEFGTCLTCSDAQTCLSADCIQGYEDEEGSCVPSTSPENSQCTQDDQSQEINCGCDVGFFGVLSWDTANMKWEGQCQPWHTCVQGEYVHVEGTAVSDRECESCIQGVSFSTTINATECTLTTDCPPGQRVLNPPTPYADRTCEPCIQDVSFSTTSNASECTSLTNCSPGEAVLLPPTTTSDRTCEPCVQDTSFSTVMNATECTVVTDCTPGQRVLNPPTPYADRTCEPCVQGVSFSTTANASECTSLTNCSPGEAVLVPPTTTSDRTCEPCVQDATFSTVMNATECTAVTDCTPGQSVLYAPTPYADRACEPCLQNISYSTTSNATFCTPLTNCVPGQSVSDTPTPTSDRTCESCVQDISYSSVMNAAECTPVTDCTPGQVVLYPPTSESNRTCEPCVQNVSFSTTNNATSCTPLTNCVPGQNVLAQPTPTSDRTCESCVPGISFSTTENSTGCDSVTDCSPGQEVLDEPSLISDRTCQTCVQNTSFSNLINADECQLLQECNENEYESQLPTLVNDRECEVLHVAVLTIDGEAHEGGSEPAVFQISIPAAQPQDLIVQFTLGGSADEGIDFELYESGNLLSGELTIPAGQTQVDVELIPLATPDIEATERVDFTIEPSLYYAPDVSRTATVSIVEHGPSNGTVYFVDTNGDDANIGDESNPFATIGFAVDQLSAGDTLYVKDGVYHNNGYVDDHGPDGDDNISNPLLASIDASGTADNWIKIAAYPDGNDVRPVLSFDGSGGIEIVSGSRYIVIEGLEIKGPNAEIVYDWAHDHRWSKESFYKGRGIFSWGPVDHVAVKNCDVHHTPGSGIRFNKSDYILVENNVVSNTTWWSSSAESAIVIATAESIDTEDAVKFLYVGNVVYNNWNFLEFCNSQYETSTDDVYGNCDYYTGGIIDGQGLYVTRNKDTYLYGRMRFENNIAFNNGFGGVVYHKTNRGELLNNLVFMNGAYPGLSNYTGLTVNTANDLTIRNNIVWARESDDYAIKNNGNASNVVSDHNYVVGTSQFGSSTDNTFIDFVHAEDLMLLFINAQDIGLAHPDPNAASGDFAPANIDDYVKNFDLDFRLVETANNIVDAGSVDLAPSTDKDGTSRPQGGGMDIGPYERY